MEPFQVIETVKGDLAAMQADGHEEVSRLKCE